MVSGSQHSLSGIWKTFSRDIFLRTSLSDRFRPPFQFSDLDLSTHELETSAYFESLLSALHIEVRATDSELSRIPSTGPLLVVCNRPFGILHAAVLGTLIQGVRADVKILASSSRPLPHQAKHFFCVDPFRGNKSRTSNTSALLQCVRWLRNGGVLVVFPATGRSQLQFPGQASDGPSWDPALARLARVTGAAILPSSFQPRNNTPSQTLDFLAQKRRSASVLLGRAIPASPASTEKSDAETTNYLRWRTLLLRQRASEKPDLASFLRPVLPKPRRDRLVAPMPTEALLSDLARLRSEQILDNSKDFLVFSAKADEIPGILPELGRLRELTFRDAGEGTGRSSDLDSFDRYYTHIVLWSKQRQEPVGAYRIGKTAEILPVRGNDGIYTSTLFRFDEAFFPKLGPALELGRSFVRPEYQRHYAPLLLLWKGIARYVAAHPETPTLFGAVSISGRYTRASRELIYRFFESRILGDALRPLVHPRRPFRPGRIRCWDCRSICHAMQELDELADPITDMESDGKGIPILIKHYHRLGGRLLGFNVDAKFSNVLDGLVVMDLRQTQPSSLERYMGKSGLAAFRSHHGLS